MNIGGYIVGVRIVEEPDSLTIGSDNLPRKVDAVDYQPQRHERHRHMFEALLRQTEQHHDRKGTVKQPAPNVPKNTSDREIGRDEQGQESATEKPVSKVIGGEIHHDSRILPQEPRGGKQMHGIIDRKCQQGACHEPARPQIVGKNALVGCLCKKKVESKKEHQHQSNAQRIFV